LYLSIGFFVYSPPPIHVYIRTLGHQMNTSAIHNSDDDKQVHVCSLQYETDKVKSIFILMPYLIRN
jgi:hypothetical protein